MFAASAPGEPSTFVAETVRPEYTKKMPVNLTPKKRRRPPGAKFFVYRGMRIMRTWTSSRRKDAIGEAMRKIIQRGPAQIAATCKAS
jgi:hypothetical protein